MPLEVGSAFARLGARLDDDGFDRFDRRVDQARQRVRQPIVAKADADTRGAVDGLDRYEHRVRKASDANENLVRGSGRLRGAMGTLFIGGAGVAAAGFAFERLGSAAMGAVDAFEESNKIALRTRNVLESTGGAAHVTADEIGALATALSKKTGMDDEAIQSGENLLLTFTNVRNEVGKGNDIFTQATGTIVDMSAALGQDTSSSAIQLGKALNDPIKGVTALQRVGVSFTKDQRDQIKTLVENGKTVDAQRLILGELRKEFGGAGEATATASGKMRVAVGNLQEAIGGKLEPVVTKIADGVASFAEGMTEGTGAGGRFVHRLEEVRDVTVDVYNAVRDGVHWFREGGTASDALAVGLGAAGGAAAVFYARMLALSILGRVQTGFAALRGAVIGVNLAMAANPVGVVIVALGALGAALYVLWKRSETFRDVVTGAWHGIEAAVRWAADKYLGYITTILGGFSSMVSAASHIPIIGDKFKGVATKIDDARDSIDRYRRGLRDVGSDHDEAGKRVDALRDRVDRLHTRLGTLRKGTDEYRATAGELRSTQAKLNDALSAAKPAGDRASRGVRNAADAADAASAAFDDAGKLIAGSYNTLAQQFGLKEVRYTSRLAGSRSSAAHDVAGRRGDSNPLLDPVLPRKAVGGIANPAGSARDDHVLVGPDGRPVAAMSGTEGILNTPQMGIVDHALRIAGALGIGGDAGGLGGLWSRGLRHFAGGGQIVPVPGFPGEQANRSILGRIAGLVRRFPSLVLTDAYGSGHKSPGHTVTGTAADFAGPDRVMDAAVRLLVGEGYLVGYDGRFGSQAWPGHGPTSVAGANAHLHVEFGSSGRAIAAPELAGVKIGGPGAMGALLRGAAGKLTGAARRRLEGAASSLAAPVAGGHGLGHYTKAALAALWRRVNPGLGNPNLMAAIGLAESAGNPDAANGPYHGLWQVGPGGPFDPVANARAAGQKLRTQGLGAWEAYTNGAYRRFLNLGGRLRRFAGGGKLSKGAPKLAGGSAQQTTGPGITSIRSLRSGLSFGVSQYDRYMYAAERNEKDYEYWDRRFNLTEEELVDPDTGAVNTDAVQARAGELQRLWDLRAAAVANITNGRKVARRVVASYRTLVGRLRGLAGNVRGNRHFVATRRAQYGKQIADLEKGLGEWRGKLTDVGDTLRDARLDWDTTGKELADVRGTQPVPQEPDDAPDDTAATSDTAAPDAAAAAPSAADIAAGVAQAFASFNAGRADLFAGFGADFMRAPSAGHALFDTEAVRAAGTRYFGGADGGSEPGVIAGAGGVTQHVHVTIADAGEAHTFTQAAMHELRAAV